MHNKIEELTSKIYKEGVEKADKEAEDLIAKAKKEEKQIIEEAKKKAEKLLTEAKKKAEELYTNTKSELQLSANQLISELKNKTTNLISEKIVVSDIKKEVANTDFLKLIISKTIENWGIKNNNYDINLLLAEEEKTKLKQYFEEKLKAELKKGLEINFSDRVKSGFFIEAKDKSFVVKFSDEDFINLFKNYIRPNIAELIF